MLVRLGEALFPRTDFPESDPSLGGAEGWCPVTLSKLVVLQDKHGWSDRETVRRARVDLQVKACLGLGIEQNGPSQPTLCRHRQRMQELGLDERYQQRLRRILEAVELVSATEPVLIDSVPVHGAGQQLDTYNLLAAAVRKGLRELAEQQQRQVQEVADELGLSQYLDRSVKGHFGVDWSDHTLRTQVLTQLVSDALRVRDLLARLAITNEQPERVSEDDGDEQSNDPPSAVEIIDDIIEHDIEMDATGQVEGITQRAAGDRLISVTDPDMRHGAKSASKLIAGFKAQIVATVTYGFILLTQVIRANEHDGKALPAVAEKLRLEGLRPKWWGGDHAYGTITNHHWFETEEEGELVARMTRPSNRGRFTKDDFAYHFDTKTLTCPAGVSLAKGSWQIRHERKGRLFVFPAETCGRCPQRKHCVSSKAKQGRTVFIVDRDEYLIRKHLERRQHPEFLERIRHRPAVERAIAGFAQCGGKQARRFGMPNVAFEANLSALAYNLRRLGSLSGANTALASHVAEAAAAAVRALAQPWRPILDLLRHLWWPTRCPQPALCALAA